RVDAELRRAVGDLVLRAERGPLRDERRTVVVAGHDGRTLEARVADRLRHRNRRGTEHEHGDERLDIHNDLLGIASPLELREPENVQPRCHGLTHRNYSLITHHPTADSAAGCSLCSDRSGAQAAGTSPTTPASSPSFPAVACRLV